ncbi:MAG: VWA domain-containing protein, partial [Dehalococcoidia bacterium]|nr:VWA domain-containing protein [Dehalococcoidia bacterium]
TPVDVVEVLDRTWSMSSAEMLRAKAGANALLEYFDPSLQHVGLAVLPAGDSWANPCPPSPSSDVWLPVSLSDDYQLPGGALDHSSRLWWTIDCLTTQSSGTYETNLGDPVQAATEELVAHGRPGEKWGIILLGDGVANVMPGTQHTGYLNCAGQTGQAPAPGGHGDGFEHNAMNACANDTNYAEDSPSGTNTSTSCTATTKDRHDFFNYGISVPTGNVVRGIEVRLDAWVDSTPLFSTRRMCVQLSWNGGTTWTAAKQTPSLTTSQTATYTLGANNDTWGRAWTLSELSNANFRVRVTDVFNSSSRTFYLDWAAVDVYYAPSSLGPCHYAADQADAAKALNPPIEIFTIGYGVNDPFNPGGNTCLDSSGPWHNRTGEELMEYMASGADHFFNEPSTADLRPIFESIGTKLAGGTHLVE